MQHAATSTDLRKHPRARLRLPARIRWHGPLGMRLEATETIDVSREGLLVRRDEPCDVPARVWVAFPFEPDAPGSVQPEIPAKVVRVEGDPSDGFRVGLSLGLPQRAPARPDGSERRRSERVPFSLPIFVRPAGTPWPEESMARGLSQSGAQFETSHIYAQGDTVLAQIPWGRWAKAGEMRGRVVRIESMDDGVGGVLTSVAVEWLKPGGF